MLETPPTNANANVHAQLFIVFKLQRSNLPRCRSMAARHIHEARQMRDFIFPHHASHKYPQLRLSFIKGNLITLKGSILKLYFFSLCHNGCMAHFLSLWQVLLFSLPPSINPSLPSPSPTTMVLATKPVF